jgi:hypothetical protein
VWQYVRWLSAVMMVAHGAVVAAARNVMLARWTEVCVLRWSGRHRVSCSLAFADVLCASVYLECAVGVALCLHVCVLRCQCVVLYCAWHCVCAVAMSAYVPV